MSRLFTSLCLFVLMFFLGNLTQVYACSCAANVSYCKRYNNAELIFVGKVVAKKSGIVTGKNGNKIDYGIESTIFEVSETISGKAVSKVSIMNGSGTSCDTAFDSGETYLVFANGNSRNGFSTGSCSGNRIFDKADEALAELNNLKNSDKGGKIFGNIYESFVTRDQIYAPMRGIELKFQEIGGSNKIYDTLADGDGNYEIFVPEGTYKIIPKTPSYATFDEERNEPKNLRNHGCLEKNFSFYNNARFGGKVVDANGKPVKDIRIELVSVNKEQPINWQSGTANSDKTGKFEFSDIPAGEYTVSVNFARDSSEEMPFPTMFYPKANERKEAQVFNVGLGKHLENITFRLPTRLKPHKITGTVVFSNGKKAAGMTVYLERRYSGTTFSSTETDGNGSFKLNGFIGDNYTFRISYDGNEIENSNFTFERTAFTLEKNTEPFRLVLKKTSVE